MVDARPTFRTAGRLPGGDALIAARLDAAPGLSTEHSSALAGFFDAEGHFAVSAANGKAPTCFAAIQLRDDDAEVLHEFQQATGCGHVSYVPARGASRPQARWRIGSKLECQALARTLSMYPLLGRKRHEARIWIDAVRIWRGQAGPTRTAALQAADAELKVLRRYRANYVDSHDETTTDAHLAGHFGGFFSGDGSLRLDVSRRRAQVLVKLRQDDIGLLRMYRDRFGLGRVIRERATSDRRPCALWHISSRVQLVDAIALLDRVPLLGVKRAQYDAWRPAAVEIALNRGRGSQPDLGVLVRSGNLLAAARRYRRSSRDSFSSTDHRHASHEAYIGALRAWSRSHPGPLTCTAYSAARKTSSNWPTRSTLVARYGSWYGALAAAGLADRALPQRRRAMRHLSRGSCLTE